MDRSTRPQTPARRGLNSSKLIAIVCGLWLAALGVRSFLQTFHWRDSFALFNHNLKVNPRSWSAYTNLATLYDEAMNPADAERCYLAAAQLRPHAAATRSNLAAWLASRGKFERAAEEYQAALRFEPGFPQAVQGLASLARLKGTAATHPAPK
jgi:Tfp pilus assembly protein PilF